MKIAWFSNAPWTPTGYGQQTAQVTRRLKADGHDVAILANYGLMGAPQVYDGITVYPGGSTPYSADIVDYETDIHFGDEDGLVISLYDVWPLLESGYEPFGKHRYACWTPIDHVPVPPRVVEWVKRNDTIAMSRFGQSELSEMGIESTYIPHAIEPVFTPTDSSIRADMGVPDDAFLVAINAANIGITPPRKSWYPMLMAFRLFAGRHDDAWLYIHTQLQHPRGIDLPRRMVAWSVPKDRIRLVDQGAYVAGLTDQSYLARIYSAADVLLMPSMGEGFGIPAIEAQACGTPVIITDFSAQPELLGAGWKVKWDPEWDFTQDAYLARPFVSSILSALEEAYEARHDAGAWDALTEAAVAKGREYDADRVYAEHWRPWLAEHEPPKPNRQQRRRSK